MKSFGESLRFYIEQSGLNIYQFARLSGINRTNIQRYISDQRFPAPEVFKAILEHLQLQPHEQVELKNAYEIAKMGESLYFQRIYVKNLLESFSVIYENEQQKTALYKDSQHEISFSPLPHGNFFHSVHGYLGIVNLLQSELSRIIRDLPLPTVCLFLPSEPNTNFLNAVLTGVPILKEQPLQIKQLFSLTKSTTDFRESNSHNLNVLSILLPLCFSFQFQYQAYFYYGNYLSNQNYGILYPYYAILNDRLIFFSQDLEDAMIFFDTSLVHHYQELFHNRLSNCQTFIHTEDAYANIINNHNLINMDIPEEPHPEYILLYHPCLTSVGNAEMARSLLRDDIPNRDAFLSLIIKRIETLQSPSNPPYHFFSEQGLRDFLETGKCMEFPPTLAKPFSLDYRLYSLERLKDFCESDKQILRITNPSTFQLPEYLSLNVVELKSSLFNFMKDDRWDIISIPETSIHLALLDFMSYLADSPYVLSKEDTLAVLNKYVENIKAKMH